MHKRIWFTIVYLHALESWCHVGFCLMGGVRMILAFLSELAFSSALLVFKYLQGISQSFANDSRNKALASARLFSFYPTKKALYIFIHLGFYVPRNPRHIILVESSCSQLTICYLLRSYMQIIVVSKNQVVIFSWNIQDYTVYEFEIGVVNKHFRGEMLSPFFATLCVRHYEWYCTKRW